MKCTLHLHLVLIGMKLCASLGRYKQIVIALASCSYFFFFGLFTVSVFSIQQLFRESLFLKLLRNGVTIAVSCVITFYKIATFKQAL